MGGGGGSKTKEISMKNIGVKRRNFNERDYRPWLTGLGNLLNVDRAGVRSLELEIPNNTTPNSSYPIHKVVSSRSFPHHHAYTIEILD